MQNSTKIKALLDVNRLRQWELADQLGWSESKLSKLLRYPVSDEDYKMLVEAVEEIKNKRRYEQRELDKNS